MLGSQQLAFCWRSCSWSVLSSATRQSVHLDRSSRELVAGCRAGRSGVAWKAGSQRQHERSSAWWSESAVESCSQRGVLSVTWTSSLLRPRGRVSEPD